MAIVHAITVHHRGEEMLATCLDSLLASSGVELQVVVVANACVEQLPGVVDSSPRVHLVRSERSIGFSAANNMGVTWARDHLGDADHYYFLNNDTRSEPDALAALVNALEENESAAIAGPRLLIEWAPEHLNSLGLNVTDDGWGWDEGIGIHQEEYGALPGRRSVVAVTGSALLIDSRVHHAIGGWTELYDYYFEDIDLCLKARAMGREVVVDPEAVVYHHVSATMTVDSEHKFFLFWRNRLLLTFIHWPLGRFPEMLKRVVVDEILKRSRADNALQRRALRGALRKLPAAVAARARARRGPRTWLEMLRPAGSVPVITLPDREMAGTADDDDEPPPVQPETETPAEDAPQRHPTPDEPAPSANEILPSLPPAPAEAVPPPPPEKPRHTLPDSTWDSARALRQRGGDGRRVLILGWSPLPFENARMNYAPGTRTWQFAHALAGDGHNLCVACARMPGAYEGENAPFSEDEQDGALVYRMDRELFEQAGVLEDLVAALDPEAVVGASPVPSLRAVRVAGDRPVWVDLFGDPMAEAQARSLVHTGVEGLGAYHDLLAETLERGDAFSAVSGRQRLAVVGQLGLTGRLNRATAGHDLVHTIPCCVVPRPRAREQDRQPLPEIGDEEFVLLWSGGYNTWCDVDTLFAALERVMAVVPGVRFLSTGGEISGHDDDTYVRWREMVNASRFADRFILKGCLPEREAARYHARADLGLVTERPIYERTLGSSGRVLGWLATGLPFACSQTSELGEQVASAGLGLTYSPGDADGLARVILDAAADPEATRAMGDRARVAALELWSAMATTEPLRRWALNPQPAPDRELANPLSAAAVARLRADHQELHASNSRLYEEYVRFNEKHSRLYAEYVDLHERHNDLFAEHNRLTREHELLAGEANELEIRATTAEERALAAEQRYNEARSELGRIHESKMWKTWMRYYAFRDALGAPLRWLRGKRR